MRTIAKFALAGLCTAQQDMGLQKGLMDAFWARHEELLNKWGVEHLKEEAKKAWSLVTQDADTLRINSMAHHERGGARSGMGTPEQSKAQERMFAERERIETMYENKEAPKDPRESKLLFDYWLERQADRPGIRQDDK